MHARAGLDVNEGLVFIQGEHLFRIYLRRPLSFYSSVYLSTMLIRNPTSEHYFHSI